MRAGSPPGPIPQNSGLHIVGLQQGLQNDCGLSCAERVCLAGRSLSRVIKIDCPGSFHSTRSWWFHIVGSSSPHRVPAWRDGVFGLLLASLRPKVSHWAAQSGPRRRVQWAELCLLHSQRLPFGGARPSSRQPPAHTHTHTHTRPSPEGLRGSGPGACRESPGPV